MAGGEQRRQSSSNNRSSGTSSVYISSRNRGIVVGVGVIVGVVIVVKQPSTSVRGREGRDRPMQDVTNDEGISNVYTPLLID